MDVRMFTVGQIAENTYIFRRDGSELPSTKGSL